MALIAVALAPISSLPKKKWNLWNSHDSTFDSHFYSYFKTELSLIVKTKLLLAKKTQLLLLESGNVREGPRTATDHRDWCIHASNSPHMCSTLSWANPIHKNLVRWAEQVLEDIDWQMKGSASERMCNLSKIIELAGNWPRAQTQSYF